MTEVTTYFKPPRVEKRKKKMRSERDRDDAYLALIRQLPCVVCKGWPTDAAHVRYTSGAHGKRNTPMGQKPSDRWALPLCRKCHSHQHQRGERDWWVAQNKNPILICAELYAARNDIVEMQKIARAT